MSISASVTWEFRATATVNMLNGGGFKTGASGTNHSLQDTAHLTIIDLESDASDNTKVFSTLTPFDVEDIGNILHINTVGSGFTVGWYEVTAVDESSPPNATLDRSCGGTGKSGGEARLGGALSLNSTLDQDFFSTSGPLIAGNKIYFKKGNYILGEDLSSGYSGSTTLPVYIIGYNEIRDAVCNGADRPNIACGAYLFSIGNYYHVLNLTMTATSANAIQSSAGSLFKNCKCNNTTSSTFRGAIQGDTLTRVIDCELICQAGYGFQSSSTGGNKLYGNYIHHCAIGVYVRTDHIINNIITNCDIGIRFIASANEIIGNTIYGSEEKVCTVGIQMQTYYGSSFILNNVIYGFVSGITATASDVQAYIDYNDIYNCTTPVSNVVEQSNDIAVDPQFTYASGTLIHDCETNWTAVGTGVTSALDIGVYKVGSSSVKVTCTASTGVEKLAIVNISTMNMSSYHGIGCWVRTETALNTGDFQLLLDNTANCSSPLKRLNFPAMATNTWYWVYLDGGDMSECTNIISIGLYQAVDKGAIAFYIDDIRGCNNDFSLQEGSGCLNSGFSYCQP